MKSNSEIFTELIDRAKFAKSNGMWSAACDASEIAEKNGTPIMKEYVKRLEVELLQAENALALYIKREAKA